MRCAGVCCVVDFVLTPGVLGAVVDAAVVSGLGVSVAHAAANAHATASARQDLLAERFIETSLFSTSSARNT
jgi:hypothetical protein